MSLWNALPGHGYLPLDSFRKFLRMFTKLFVLKQIVFLVMVLLMTSFMLSCSSDSSSGQDPRDPDDSQTEDLGELSGMVTDEDGNVYDNVSITLKEGTTTLRVVRTENTGVYTFTNVRVGSYTVEIELPLSSSAVGSDSHSVTIRKNATSNADFVVRPSSIEGDLVLGAGDILGEVRNAMGNVPSSASELLYAVNVFTDQALVPILDAEGDHVTLGQWDNAEGVAEIYCDGETSYFELSFSGLLPDGVYTLWVGTMNTQPMGTGAMGNPNGTENVLDVDGAGNASISVEMDSGSLSVSGSIPSCVLTSQLDVVLILDYHIDGNTYGPSPGPDHTDVGHIIFSL